MHRYNSFLKKSDGKGRDKTVSDADYNKFLDTIKYTNSIINKRSYNWLLLLDNLEKFVPPGVSLTSLQPSAKEDSSKLSGIAISFGAVRRFMENLELSGVFTDIFLTQQSIVKIENKRQAISFSITFKAIPL
jgi:Tfp pilus assembly protein PilN